MNYLGSPIFPFAPDRSSAVSRQVLFDLRAEDIGFGAEYFTPTATWAVNQWSFGVTIGDAPTLMAFNAFFQNLTGRLNGFWLPVPNFLARVVGGNSTTVFFVAAETLSTFWQDAADVYLLFTFADGTQAAAQIQGVAADGATETVTLTAALPQTPDAGTTVQKLQFVRLAGDELAGEFFAELGAKKFQITLVELPLEYVAALLGLRPVFLFHFYAAAPVSANWYYTSFAAPVASQNQLYPNFPVNFSDLTESHDGSNDGVKIEAKPDPNHPFSLFQPLPFSGVLYVTILAVDLSAPDAQTVLFDGRVVSVEDEGTKLTGTCENRIGYFKRKIPCHTKGQTCQNTLYDPATCKAPRAFFETTITITASSDANTFPPTVTGTFLLPAFESKFQAANYLSLGFFESGVGVNYECRTILASNYNADTGRLTLTLNYPLVRTVAGANAQVVAGCDHTPGPNGCARFNNFQNFTGFLTIPPRNPTLKAINANPVSQGGK